MEARRIVLLRMSAALVTVLLLASVSTTVVLADNGPHGGYTPTSDACAGCHRAHTAGTGKLLLAAVPALCLTCHGSAGNGADTDVVDGVYHERDSETESPPEGVENRGLRGGGFQRALMDTDAMTATTVIISPTTSTHLADGSLGTAWGNGPLNSVPDPGAADFSLSCVSCHDPHGGGTYRILRPIPTDSAAGIPITVSDEVTKTYTVADSGNSYIEESYGALGSPLAAWCSQCHTRYMAPSGSGRSDSGDPIFAYRHSTTNVSCVRCHVAHGSTARMGFYSGAVLWPDEAPIPSGDERSSLLRLDNRGVCAYCHVTSQGAFSGACNACHGQPPETGSHATHFDTARGPQIETAVCENCHSFSRTSHMDGNVTMISTLADTDACDNCHSPGGTYDGVNDVAFGAKANWATGVYEGGDLAPGKEQWCAGCHDGEPANSKPDGSGVDAPNVIGDEDGAYPYGTGWGFYQTGHGLASGTYPASGAAAANLECLDCHDASISHIDHDPRTYRPDSDYATLDPVSEDYQTGFRLVDIATGYDGQYPMHIPRTGNVFPPGFRVDWEFALCFSCHDRDRLFDGGDPLTGEGAGTNFRAQSNGDGAGNPLPTTGLYYSMHDVHTWGANGPVGAGTPQYDSDFDGTADSRMSCPACHNVHGSPSPTMIRHGELISTPGTDDKVPALGFQYTTVGLYPTLADSTGGAIRFIGPGPGGVAKNGICNMCHNDHMTYARTPMLGHRPNRPSNVSPPHGASDIPTSPTLVSSAFTDPDVGDTHQASQWQITMTPGAYGSPVYDSGPTSDLSSHTLAVSLNNSVTYYWHLRHQDSNGAWSHYSAETAFTTVPGGGPQTLVLRPSDVASDGGFGTTGGSWSNILDSNDGDASYVNACCGGPGASFYVDMDGAGGLTGASIQSIQIYVHARYLDGPWPGAVPYAGNVNVGYRTGANTVWMGNTATDTSGAYILIQSPTYVTDSDGGVLDLADIDNLQIAVRRNVVGPPQLRVTEVYVVVIYIP